MKYFFENILDLFNLMSLKQKKNYFLILFFFIMAAFFELLGISLVFALLTVIISDKTNFILPILNYQINFIGTGYLLFFVCFLYFFKSLFLSFYYWFQNKFVYDFEAHISKKLFLGYLKSSFLFHNRFDSSHLIRNITVESGQLSGGILMTSLEVARNIFLFLILLSFLIFINPTLTIIILFFLLLIGLLYQSIMSKRNLHWGKDRQIQTGLRLKKLQEGFLGIQTIQSSQKEEFFYDRFLPHLFKINRIRLLQTFFQSFPRIWLEFIAVFSMVVLLLALQNINKNFVDFIPLLGAISLVIIRIIPSFNNLINNIQVFDYSRSAISKIKEDFLSFKSENINFDEDKKKTINNFKLNKGLKLTNVSYKYPSSEKTIIKNISLEIKKNQSIGFIGESGSGKSTLIGLILGYLKPENGKIYIDENDATSDLIKYKSIFGYVPQNIFIFDDTLEKNITFEEKTDLENKKKLEYVIEKTNLAQFYETIENSNHTSLGELGSKLSGGEKQRIAIARALYKNSQILIFDEITKSLDEKNRKIVNDVIADLKKEKTIINISHFENELNSYDSVYKVVDGYLEKVI